MRNRVFRVSSNKSGFTIIELLVVIVIIAVITALTMAIYTGIQAKVLDSGITTDLDRLNALEMSYKSNHGNAGKAYYSGNGPDSELGNFVPKNGDVIDVVVDTVDYCIRGYNHNSTKDTIFNAFTKESSTGSCGRIAPSAIAAATPSVPLAPVITLALNNGNALATVTPVTCAVGTAQYSFKSRTDDGSWTSYSDWSDTTTSSQTADEGVKYGYIAQSRCFVTYTSTASIPSTGIEATYTRLYSPSAPVTTVSLNGGNVLSTISSDACTSGTIQYEINSRVNDGAWTGYTSWSSAMTATQAITGEGIKYGYNAQARCYIDDSAYSSVSIGAEGIYISAVTTPAVPTVSVSTTAGYVSTYSWPAVSCAAGITARYQYRLTVAPSGYDSGWASTAGLSAVFTTSTGDQTYTVQTQGQCYNVYASSSWSASGTANYFCVSDSNPIATSISGTWATAPSGYMLEDGTAISRATYPDLFAAIGTTYGVGDGSTTFNLPDSRGRATVNKNPSDGEFATIGQKSGEKYHTLTTGELPAHNHGQNVAANANSGGPGNRIDYNADVTGASVYSQGLSTQNTGGGGAHTTIQPSIVKVFAIKYRPATVANSMLSAASSIVGYWSSVPTGYLSEDGSAVLRTTYSDLFAAIGTTYGAGDGSTTFNLPDSRGRVTVNKNPSDAEFATIGQKYGEKYHTLSIAEMPSHNHPQNVSANWNSGGPAWRWDFDFDVTGASVYSQGINTDNTGSGSGHNTIQPSIVKMFVIKYSAPAGLVDVLSKGTTIQGYWPTAPSGYLLEDGLAVSRATYSALFTAIGTTYGAGDGLTTFNLPDSRGRIAVNKNPSDAEFATIGQKFGEKVHTLTIAEMPAHSHGQNVSANPNSGGPAWRLDWNSDGTGAGIYSQGITTLNTGGDGAHNNIQPSIVQSFAIRY